MDAPLLGHEPTVAPPRFEQAFLHHIGHEVRTPLAVILGFCELLAADASDDQREIVQMIHASGQRLLKTFETLVDLAKLDSGLLQLRPVSLDLQEILRQVVHEVAPSLDVTGATVALPGPGEPLPVLADPGALSRVLASILTVAAGSSAGVRLTATVHREAVAGVLLLESHTETARTAIPVASAEARQAQEDATTLALDVAHRLVRQMSGTLEIRHEERGSRYRIELPLTAALSEQRSTDAPHRVLVLDPDVALTFRLHQLLPARCEICQVDDLDEAVATVRAEAFDVVVVNVEEAPADDIEGIIQTLREENPHASTPILARVPDAEAFGTRFLVAAGFDGIFDDRLPSAHLGALLDVPGTARVGAYR